MNLVVIEKDIFSFYSLGEHVISVQSVDMTRQDLEFYRQNLDVLVAEVQLASLADATQLELEF